MLKKLVSIIFQMTMGIVFLMGTAISEVRTILLSEEGQWPPYTYESEGTATKGLSFELMAEIFHRLQIPYELKLYPQQRCIEQMKSGERDAITLISKNPDREEFLEYTVPIVQSFGLIYYSASRPQPIQWETFADLQSYKIGVVAGHNYGKAFNKAREQYQFRVESVIKIEQNFEKLLNGRIDIMLANQDEVSAMIKKNPHYQDKIRAADKPYIDYAYHIGFSRKSEARQLVPLINQVILKMKVDGTLTQILERHLR
ncbi:MAG: polar amino acid transport system substrate-binding protein [Pseudomonadota bacterium]|nr:polar amino acid transport system substrate-binding protein [Pseudomonadota bacterium]